MNQELPSDDGENAPLPEELHQELGRRRVRLWWVVIGLLLAALALMFLAQRLRKMEEAGPNEKQASNLSGFSPISPECHFAPSQANLRARIVCIIHP